MTACLTRGVRCKHGKPGRTANGSWRPELREESTGSTRVAERLVVAGKPGNSGGAKEPLFKAMTEEGKARRLA